MRNEFFTSMSINRQRFIEEIKSGKNPNPLRNRVEEEPKKAENVVRIAEKSLLQVERVYHHTEAERAVHAHREKEYAVMETLGVRRASFMERFREAVLRRICELFEAPVLEMG